MGVATITLQDPSRLDKRNQCKKYLSCMLEIEFLGSMKGGAVMIGIDALLQLDDNCKYK